MDPRRLRGTRGPQDGRAAELPDDTGARGQPQGMSPPGPKMPTEITQRPDGLVPTVTPNVGKPRLQTGPTGASRVQKPEPVAHDREGAPIQGVSGRLTGLLSRTSPYIQRARTRAAQTANRRGLLNTSIAAGAGEAAAIDAALPIATADAGIAQAERGMRSTEFMQERGIEHDAKMQEAQRDLTKLLQEREHRVQQLMQSQRLSHDAAQRQADREFQGDMQAAEHRFQTAQAEAQRTFAGSQAALDRLAAKLAQERGIGADEARQEAQNEFAGRQASLDREAQRIAQERGISFEEAQAEANRNLKRQIATQTATQAAQDQYQTSLDRLAVNTELPAEERARLEEHYAFLRDQAIDAIEGTYEVELDWAESTRQPEPEAEAA